MDTTCTFMLSLILPFYYFKVRDRATLYLNMLEGDVVGETGNDVKEFLFGSLNVPLANLESSLQNYVGHSLLAQLYRVFLLSSVKSHFLFNRYRLRNHLTFTLYQRRLSHRLYQRKNPKVKKQTLLEHHRLPLQHMLMHMKDFFPLFPSSRTLGYFLRFSNQMIIFENLKFLECFLKWSVTKLFVLSLHSHLIR